MGKNSLLKPTSKEEADQKKSGKAKKTGKKAAPKKSAPPKKAAKKTAAKAPKKTKPKVTAKSQPKQEKPPAKKAGAPEAKPAVKAESKQPAPKVSVKVLLTKKFDRWTPEKPYRVPEEKRSESPSMPPIISGVDAGEEKRLKSLLLKKIDLTSSADQPLPEAPDPPESDTPAENSEPPRPEKPTDQPEKPMPTETAVESSDAARHSDVPDPAPPSPGNAEQTAQTAAPGKDVSMEKTPQSTEGEKEDAAASRQTPTPPDPAPQKQAEGILKNEPTDPEEAPEAKISYDPPGGAPPPDPFQKFIKYAGGGFALLILILLTVSYMNTRNYYLEETEKGIEIRQGLFAPLGSKTLLALPGEKAPEPLKDVYTQKEVFPLAFQYFMNKADERLDVEEMPDLEKIRENLNRASNYAVSAKMEETVRGRLDFIDMTLLLYKAEVAAGKNTIPDLERAIDYLRNAESLAPEQTQKTIIRERIDRYRQLKSAAAAKAAQNRKAAKLEAENKQSVQPQMNAKPESD